MASYQASIGRITSPICPHCGSGEETAEHLLLSCPRWGAEPQRHFGDSTDIKDVFQDYVNLVEFLIPSGHLPPHIGIAWWARRNNIHKLKLHGTPAVIYYNITYNISFLCLDIHMSLHLTNLSCGWDFVPYCISKRLLMINFHVYVSLLLSDWLSVIDCSTYFTVSFQPLMVVFRKFLILIYLSDFYIGKLTEIT